MGLIDTYRRSIYILHSLSQQGRITVTMDHDQYDYHDSDYPNPEEAYDEPNGFHDDSYDANDYDDANDDVGGNDHESNGYEAYQDDSYPDQQQQQQSPHDASPDDFDDNPSLDSNHRHFSPIYQDDAGLVMDHDPITEYLKSKDPDWDVQPAEPKNLLDLPEDILRLVVKEASHSCPLL